ncbi:hypothetical protein D3C86_2047290 [compost metagenome]
MLVRTRRIGLFGSQAARGGARAHAGVAQQDGQQDQVGEDQHRDADGRGSRQFADDLDVDHQQHREAHRVGQQGRESGEE